MLPKKRRIERKEFQYILGNGKRYNSPNFLLYIANISHKNDENNSRFSFSVSKKVCKNAVDRNRLRRVGYSIISKQMDKIINNKFFFFVFKKGSQNIKFDVLEKEVLELLSETLVLR